MRKNLGLDWNGGSLGQWIEEHKEMIVSTLSCGNLVEYRLTNAGRKILRGIMKKIGYFYENGLIHDNLDENNIFVLANHEVHIAEPNFQKGHNHTSCARDCAAVKQVIKLMIGINQYPKDVVHLAKVVD
ncbi:hypothetical protein RHGRI_022591 [Rhododendron griersonianum]|uniref:Protein kinase domain-containing protein n=1 Tax=Rhododendron griersonianum TaxID=479676 RepID=A0AAV6J034_9ERIC|nr:hypothetical protein RHGRI_022591 [Rhododendron griersonianum]